MLILHADINALEKSIYEGLDQRADTTLVHLELEKDILDFLDKNDISLLLVGENLKNSSGLNLINTINNSSYLGIPIIYIVDNENDYYMENYSKIGVRDCFLLSDLSLMKIDRHIRTLSEQKKLYEGMSNLSVAVIDDSPLSLKVVNGLLKDEGIKNVKSFSDPVTLLKEYEAFSLFIVDIVMPGITGDKLVGMIRRMSPNSIIIAMSAVDNVKTISHVLSIGADDYLVKPFNNFELRARIRTNYRSFMLLQELEDKNKELARLSKTDSLTGACNHGFLVSSIKDIIISSRLVNSSFSMLMLDLDFFKKVNDNYGHATGDDVLVALSNLFINKIRNNDIFGRYGGEEFLLLMPNTAIDKASIITNSLSSLFSSLKIGEIDSPITFSGGLVQWDGEESYKELMKRADDMLYSAKNTGRNKIME